MTIDHEELQLLAELNGQLTEKLNRETQRREQAETELSWARRARVLRSAVLVCGCTVVGAALLLFGLWALSTWLKTPSVVTHCRVTPAQAESRGDLCPCPCYALEGVIPWHSDSTIGFYGSPTEALERARQLDCTVLPDGAEN